MISPAKTRVTTPFGWVKGYPLYNQSYPGYGNAPGPGYGFHTGVDFSWSPDNKIYMPEDGIVQLFPWDGKSYDGNAIVVAVDNRRHFMGHIKKGGFLVGNGQRVAKGTPIAIMGDTGFAIGVHLHWGLRIDGKLVNGLNYIEGDSDMSTVGELEFNRLFIANFGPMERNQPTTEDRKRWIGAETNTVIRSMDADPRRAAYLQYVADLEKAVQNPGTPAPSPDTFMPYSGEPLYTKKS